MINALKTGESLKNPVFWKKAQMGLAVVAGFMPLVVTMFPSLQSIIDNDLIAKADGAIAAVVVYLTVATTDKMGV